MKVLVIGSGAREHSIITKLAQSPKLLKLYCAPGNAGIAALAECVNIRIDDIQGLLSFALDNKIELTVVGPEAPLVQGIVDVFEQNGLRIFGPNQKAAQLEGSKAYSKDFMQRHGIPTARYKTYRDCESAIGELQLFDLPVVIKVDGLAAGKGVIIAESTQEAVDAIRSIMGDKRFGEAGSTIVVEEYLFGKEVTVLAFVDGKSVVPMVSSQDYKRALDGDEGLNTGGMGAVSPAFHYNAEIEEIVKPQIIYKTVQALHDEKITYRGVLYFGLMLTSSGPKVLEYNVRFGDPETEVVLTRLQSDLFDIMNSIIDDKLEETAISWSEDSSVCVVIASGGYPEDYNTGYEISGIEAANEAIVFHAGTRTIDSKLVTAGGRVLVISAAGKNYQEARSKTYSAIEKIKFENMYYRKDIGIK